MFRKESQKRQQTHWKPEIYFQWGSVQPENRQPVSPSACQLARRTAPIGCPGGFKFFLLVENTRWKYFQRVDRLDESLLVENTRWKSDFQRVAASANFRSHFGSRPLDSCHIPFCSLCAMPKTPIDVLPKAVAEFKQMLEASGKLSPEGISHKDASAMRNKAATAMRIHIAEHNPYKEDIYI